MGTKEKLLKRFCDLPKDFTYNELVVLLGYLGYERKHSGKTSGSREKFINPDLKSVISFHRPHPKGIIKETPLKDIYETLNKLGLLN